MDQQPASQEVNRYRDEASKPNEALYGVTEEDAFAQAYKISNGIIDTVKGATPKGFPPIIKLVDFGETVLGKLSTHWFGIPDDGFIVGGVSAGNEEKLVCPADFIKVGRYVFNPGPSQFAKREGQKQGQELLKAGEKYVEKILQEIADVSKSTSLNSHKEIVENTVTGSLAWGLFEHLTNPRQIARTLLGQVHGFAAPTFGSYISVMSELLEDKSLWRLQQDWLENVGAKSDKAMEAATYLRNDIIKAMCKGPKPKQIHRTAVKSSKINTVDVEPGDKIVLNIASAASECQKQPSSRVLFGGDYGNTRDKGSHACPGQKIAMGVLQGMLAALLEAGNLEEQTRLIVAIKS
jgi:hypothetical protein